MQFVLLLLKILVYNRWLPASWAIKVMDLVRKYLFLIVWVVRVYYALIINIYGPT